MSAAGRALADIRLRRSAGASALAELDSIEEAETSALLKKLCDPVDRALASGRLVKVSGAPKRPAQHGKKTTRELANGVVTRVRLCNAAMFEIELRCAALQSTVSHLDAMAIRLAARVGELEAQLAGSVPQAAAPKPYTPKTPEPDYNLLHILKATS